MNSKTYWAKRAAEEMRRRVDDAEKLNRALLIAYTLAKQEINRSAGLVFDKYQTVHGLTRKEAEALLKRVRSPEDTQALLRELKKDPKNAELIKQLEAGAYGTRLRHFAALQAAIDTIALTLATRTEAGLTELLEEMAKGSYYRAIFEVQRETGYYTPFKALSAEKIDEVLHKGWSGADFSRRIWKNREALAEALKEEVTVSLLTGRNLKRATDALAERLDAGYSNTKRVVRTETTYVSNELRAKGYQETGVEQYIYVAILDLRTSKICRSLDKKVFPLSDRKVGTNYPPMHPYCRSTTIPWVPPELLHKMKQRARDPATGKTIIVPADMTYQEWYKTYVEGAQKRVSRRASEPRPRLAPLEDVTSEWKAETPLEEPNVTIGTTYTAPDGTEYTVDGHNVVQDHNQRELAVAETVSIAKGEQVVMLPRVNYPEGITTPDCSVGGVLYEIKTSKGAGKNAIKNAIRRGKGQTSRIIIDISQSPLSPDEIERQILAVKSDNDLSFVEELVVAGDKDVQQVFRRQ